MTTSKLIESAKELGYKIRISHKNITKRKTKVQFFVQSKKQPIAWVFTNEMYSMRSLGVDSELFRLMVEYSETPICFRGEV